MCRQPPRPSPRTRGAAGPPPLLQRPRSGAQGGLLPALLWERVQPPHGQGRGAPHGLSPSAGAVHAGSSRLSWGCREGPEPPQVSRGAQGRPGSAAVGTHAAFAQGSSGQPSLHPDSPRAGPARLLLLAAPVLPPSPTAGPRRAALCVLLPLALSGVSENREPASAPHPQSKLPVSCKAATDGHTQS